MTLMIRFHNTLGGSVELFVPLRPGEVKLYTCGPTVYDFPHIGNWRAYIFEDLLKRFLLFSGLKVTHVMNITDVDDKTIRGANAKGLTLGEYTRPFIEAFYADRDVLNILPADHYPRATEHIPEMVAIVRTLLDKGYAYEKDGSIYFSIAKFPAYGRLSKINLEDLRPGQRGDSDEYEKESVHDFALWKAKKEGEPSWETPIGPGRPGWHIECSAMSSKYLGPTFDIHCGGVDNIFPHHENEIAQSEAANGVKFVNYWLHCHHLVVNGEKMAKSKGNFYTLNDILAKGYDPREVRFLLLSTHYRKMLNFTFETLEQAKAALKRIDDFIFELEHVTREASANPGANRLIDAARQGFVSGLEDDLNISEALASLFEYIKATNILLAQKGVGRSDAANILSFVRTIDRVLAISKPKPPTHVIQPKGIESAGKMGTPGLQGTVPSELRPVEDGLDEKVQKKVDERQKARAEKNFKLADDIRKELLAQGILLEDTKDGIRWKRVQPPRS